MLLIVIIAVAAIAAKLNAPSKGTINQHPTAKVTPHLSTQTTAPSTQGTAYYSLELPAGYAQVASASPPPGILAVQTLSKQLAIGKLVVAIAIKSMPEGGVSGDSAYQLRTAHPERYTLTTKTIQGDVVTIANDSQSAAVVAFWPHQSYEATISLTMGFEGPAADGNADELDQLQTILTAWRWQ